VVSFVVAHARNRVIGRAGGLPWHLPTDMRRFRDLTRGHAVVMGRRTFESLPAAYRPLPDRRNLVLSTDPSHAAPGAEVFGDLAAALAACRGECFVIGGGATYAEALPLAQRVYVTEIDAEFEGDTFFPALPDADWRCVESSARVIENGHGFTFRLYERAG
jgi:dihydrofolate reductase